MRQSHRKNRGTSVQQKVLIHNVKQHRRNVFSTCRYTRRKFGTKQEIFVTGTLYVSLRWLRGHYTYHAIAAPGFGPGFWRASVRPVRVSRSATKAAEPSGRPVRALCRNASRSASSSPWSSSPRQSATISSVGATRTKASSRPARWAAALDQGHSSARATRPARTGLSST